jgi:hypothetical protein
MRTGKAFSGLVDDYSFRNKEVHESTAYIVRMRVWRETAVLIGAVLNEKNIINQGLQISK